MVYFTELRANWRPLAATVIGLASGMSVIGFITSTMAPRFMAEFGWTREDFAYVNSLGIFSFIVLPIIGRLADLIGVRRTALIGVTTLPLSFILLSMMTGDIRQYIALFLMQAIFGLTTTVTVYSRVIVQYIDKTRGLALGIAGAAPAIVGLFGAGPLGDFVGNHGWRAGYQLIAAIFFITGVIALLMVPAERKAAAAITTESRWVRITRDYPMIARNAAFWVMLVALLLINLPQTIAIAQLGLVVEDNGISAANVGFMVSALSAGMLAGRLGCGIALDHWPAHLIAAISMILPSIGLFLLASDFNSFAVVTTAVLLVGVAYGAEGDIITFLVSRIFGVRVYSSVMGLLTAAISVTTSVGAALAGLTLKQTHGYALFLSITGTTVLIGALLFLFLPAASRRDAARAPAGAE